MHGQRAAAPGGSEGPKGFTEVQGGQRVAMHGQRGAAPACMKVATSSQALALLIFTVQVSKQTCKTTSKQ